MDVRTIKSKDGNTLVEWLENANLYRAWLPNKEVVNNEVKTPEKGLPYGDDLTPLLRHLPTAAVIMQALHNNGLWTLEDIKANPSLALSALGTIYGQIINALVFGELEKEKDK